MHDLSLGHGALHSSLSRLSFLLWSGGRGPVVMLQHVVQRSTSRVPELDGRVRPDREDGGEEA